MKAILFLLHQPATTTTTRTKTRMNVPLLLPFPFFPLFSLKLVVQVVEMLFAENHFLL